MVSGKSSSWTLGARIGDSWDWFQDVDALESIKTGEFLITGTCSRVNIPVAICCWAALPPRQPSAVLLCLSSRYTMEHPCRRRRGTSWKPATATPITRSLNPQLPGFFFYNRLLLSFLAERTNTILLNKPFVMSLVHHGKQFWRLMTARSLTVAGVKSPCCSHSCWGWCHQCWHWVGRGDRAPVTYSVHLLQREDTWTQVTHQQGNVP